MTKVYIENFKCFDRVDLPFGQLTLLTGYNAGGKSTSLQSILLLTQTLRTNNRALELRLNGPLLRLGSPADVINQDRGGNRMLLGIENSAVAIKWLFQADDSEDRRTLRVVNIEANAAGSKREVSLPEQLDCLLPCGWQEGGGDELVTGLKEAIFLSALRQIDNDVFPVPEEPKPTQGDVGTLGEYAAWWLHHFDDDSVAVERCANNSGAPRTLRGQVNAWANELFPGAEVNAQPVPKTSLMRLELRTGRQEDWRRPTNIGYGLSYAFPALLAGLLAKRGQILIIDSPEAHLHPQGQSRMGGFLAQIAAAGPQVILETHSDHVLNGIRVAVRDKAINADQVSIQFFNPRDGERKGIPQVVAVSVDEKGNLSHWPEGFFDQSEKDLASLAGWV